MNFMGAISFALPFTQHLEEKMANAMEQGGIVCEKKAAQFLGISVRTLQQRRYLRLPPKFILLPGSRTIRYRVCDLRAFIENGLIDY